MRPFEEYKVTRPVLERVAQYREWVVINEPSRAPLGVFVESAILPHVKAGRSCAIVGDAGTDNTQALKAIEADLQQQGLHSVTMCNVDTQ